LCSSESLPLFTNSSQSDIAWRTESHIAFIILKIYIYLINSSQMIIYKDIKNFSIHKACILFKIYDNFFSYKHFIYKKK
jgi:hypothetical protein